MASENVVSKSSDVASSSSEIVEAVSSLTVSSPKMVSLKSNDDVIFEMDEEVARKFTLVAHIIEDGCADNTIPIENVNAEILGIVIDYAEMHVKAAGSTHDVEEGEEAKKKLDADFIGKLDLETIFHVILAANYLNYQELLGVACQMVADHIKDKTPEEVRDIFNIENDFTKEEEEEIRKEKAWTFSTD